MFRSKKTPEPSRRQRYVRPQSGPQPFSYRSLRSEATAPLGRHQSLPTTKAARSGKFVVWARFWGQRIGFVVGALALLVCLVELLALSANVKIAPADPDSQPYLLHNTASYAQTANQLFADSFANRNKITVNTDEIAGKLRAEFPELSDVSITLPLIGHRPIVYVQANRPALILIEGGQRLLLSQDGRVEARVDQVSSSAAQGLPVVLDQSNLLPRADGTTVLSVAEVSFIRTILFELQHGGVKPGTLSLPAAAQELDVSITDQPFVVKFNMQSDTGRQQAGTFLATWQYLRQHHIVPNKYVDVRVDGQAYYK